MVSRRTLSCLALVAIAAIVSALAADSLPARLTTHWNAQGTPDGTLSKPVALAFGPGIALALTGLWAVLPRIDPRGGYESFGRAYDAIAVAVTAFVVYVHVVVIGWNLGWELSMTAAIAPAVGLLFVTIGYAIRDAEQNWFVGFRTPWTLADERVWRRVHRVGGIGFAVAGVIAALGALFPQYFVVLVAGPAFALALGLTVYSYVLYARREHDNDRRESV